jgi:restriction endonuclease S subunit
MNHRPPCMLTIEFMVLKDIASIRTGYTFRGGIEHDKNGALCVVQIKDIAIGEPINWSKLVRTNLDNVRQDNLLKKGDVLFISRGTRNHAVHIDTDVDNVLFGAQLLAIRTGNKVLPSYLACYLNQKFIQQLFEEWAVGSNVKVLSKSILNQLPVAVPPLEIQQKVVDIWELSLQEEKLMEEIQTKRRQVVDETLSKFLRGKLI